MTELTEQDVAVLKQLQKEYPLKKLCTQECRFVKRIAVLARLAEADKCKKEIEELSFELPEGVGCADSYDDAAEMGFRLAIEKLARLGGKKDE